MITNISTNQVHGYKNVNKFIKTADQVLQMGKQLGTCERGNELSQTPRTSNMN